MNTPRMVVAAVILCLFTFAASAQEFWGSLEGRVTWKGKLPEIKSFEEMIRKHPDAAELLKAPKETMFDPTWRIDAKSKGIANVCVYLKRPADKIMPIHADDKIRKESIVIDTPFGYYNPHMAATYFEWFDGKDRGRTGQKFVIKNSSAVNQSSRLVGPELGDGRGNMIVAFGEFPQERPINSHSIPYDILSDIHVWMKGYVWSFDHPYFAITKADGTFMIPRVPAGMEVRVMAWHEGQGWLFTKDGRAMTLRAGKNTLDFEMSAK